MEEVLDSTKNPFTGLKLLLTFSGIRVENPTYAFPVAFVWCILGVPSIGVFLVSLLMFMNNMDDLFCLVHHLTLFSTIIISVVWSYVKRDNWHSIVKDVHKMFNYKSKMVNTNKLAELIKQRQKRLQWTFNILVFFTLFNVVNIWLFSVVEAYVENKPYILLYPVYLPFGLESWLIYSLVIIWQLMVIAAILLTIYGILGVLMMFYDYLSSEIHLLTYSILNVKKRAKEIAKQKWGKIAKDKAIRDQCLIVAMNQCGKHHTLICDYYLNAVKVIRFTYFVIVIVGLTALTCGGAAIMYGSTFSKLKFFFILVITFVYLYIAFWFGDEIRDLGDSIRWLFYEIDWLNMPRECHSTIRLMMVRTMRPLILTTSLGQGVDLENFMDLVKASYTYFNMIYQSSQQDIKL